MALANTFFTTKEVATKLGVSRGRVSQLCVALRGVGEEIGTLVGPALVFTDIEIKRLRDSIKPTGRPKGTQKQSQRNSKMMA